MQDYQDFYVIRGQRASPFEVTIKPKPMAPTAKPVRTALPLPPVTVEQGKHPTLVSRLGILQMLRNSYT
jgi:hypothetical protein